MPDMILMEAEEKMEKSVQAFEHELAQVRTGRANPAILDSVFVNYYGCPTQLKQMSSISTPEANQLYIKPFDKSSLKDIEVAISAANLGLNPQGDGIGIRIVLHAMTEERRKDLVKQVGRVAEEGKVAVRNLRRDANDALKKLDLPEDEEKGYLDDVQKLTDKYIAKIEDIADAKSKELMNI